MKFSLNHMVSPHLNYAEFFDLALRLGVNAVEIRNDIPTALMGIKNAKAIGKLAQDKGIEIINVNALQRWNQWDLKKSDEAKRLAEYTATTGAKNLILVPTNDKKFSPASAERLNGLRVALSGLKQILKDNNLIGCVEPLGFAECSLRLKAEAIAAINDVGGHKRFKVTHDTFHHFVAGEDEVFADRTGLIHVSGVVDPKHTATTMRDPQRVLVDANDMIDNKGQLRRLFASGYKGYVSFEPFAAQVHKDRAIARSLSRSMDYLES
ncbi:TIM barrel protein [Aestuariivirga litoralis]|uniref:TIM barrel protein n=1 Tax=Aestuariivirga litoralis TaxID=2650924 RepID=UPI0018C54EF8|nr:TIM barrel protein [Aestuariivirga litoralis]MBG1233506.1 TIM barrel protein [Aestuariivirga litoralis]